MSDNPPSPKRPKIEDHQEIIPPSTMIILVGLPGSGKSTLASSLIRQSPLRWARINQDSINKGKRGTRDMCLNAATLALQQGYNIIIDRTSLTREHRKYFIDLATTSGVDPSNVHCIFLNLPVKECGSRAAGRDVHEGGVIGNGAYGIVGRMQKELKASGPPSLSEGFASLIECQNNTEINLALDLWVRYTTQIHNQEGEVLNLSQEWEKIRPKRTKGTSNGGGGASAGGSGLQRLDKFFIKKTTNADTNSKDNASTGVDKGAGPSFSAPAAADTAPNTKNKLKTGDANNAFSILMTSSKQQSSPFPAKKQPAKSTTTRHHFRSAPALYALNRYLHNPEELLLLHDTPSTNTTATPSASDDNTVLYCDSQCVIVSDKYPKSRYHILVLARDQRLQGPLDLTGADSALVRHMKDIGLQWAADHAPDSASYCGFAAGFHSVPSMRHLHLHIISKDYDSPSLKNKKHWNSFTTPFFLDVDWVLHQLESMNTSGQQYLDYDVEGKEALLKGTMSCPRCKAVLPRMPDVKSHVEICTGKGGEGK